MGTLKKPRKLRKCSITDLRIPIHPLYTVTQIVFIFLWQMLSAEVRFKLFSILILDVISFRCLREYDRVTPPNRALGSTSASLSPHDKDKTNYTIISKLVFSIIQFQNLMDYRLACYDFSQDNIYITFYTCQTHAHHCFYQYS